MKSSIIIIFLSLLIFTSCVNNEKNEVKQVKHKPGISYIKVGQDYNLENYYCGSWKSPKTSYANEYTTTYLFENKTSWDWLYITVDNKTNKVISIRTKNQRTR